MDLHHLKYVVVAAEEGSFHDASERLKVAPSALSRRIQDLESELGVALFERISGGIRPSYAGEVLIGYARRIFAEVEATAEHFRRLANGQETVLRIALNGIAPQLPVVPALFRRFRIRHPEVELKLIAMRSSDQLDALRAGNIDAGILYARPEDAPDLTCLRLASHRFVLALPLHHALAGIDEIRLEMLANEDFVFFTRSFGTGIYDRLMANCRAHGLAPRVIQETSSEHMQLGLVAAGMGVSFVFDSVVDRQNRPDILIKTVRDLAVEEHLDLTWRQDDTTPALAQFVALAVQNGVHAANSSDDQEK